MDWPSRELSQRLAEWRLCTPQDVQRCRRAVRNLVRDLPSFDSVWIDVLLQQRLLTPDQARILDSANPDRLCFSGHVISDCLEENAWRAVYRVKSLDASTPCLVTLHGVDPDDRTRVLDSIDATVSRLRGCSVEGLELPLRAEVGERELMVYSTNVSGIPLRDLLIRRGRFPEPATLAIARHLVGLLAALEDRDVPHGDVRCRNVWLSDDGRVHLLHAGLMDAVLPTFLLSQELPLEVCDGVAPEVARSGRRTSHSDQYALASLLWQLVAGRPPFPTGDAQSKISAHRTRAMPAVRDFAPQVSEHLARVIARLGQKAAGDRYASFREVALEMGPATKADQRLLKRFVRNFETEAPTQTARETGERGRQLPSAIAAVVIGGATIWLFTSDPTSLQRPGKPQANTPPPRTLPVDADARPIAAQATSDAQVVPVAGSRVVPALRPLPNPDASGVISLQAGAVYEARNLKFRGPLQIRGADAGLARVVVADSGWEVTADSLRLENVQLEGRNTVRVQTRGLEVVKSVVMNGSDRAAIEWGPQDAAAVSPGTIQLVNSHVLGPGLVFRLRPSQVRIVNCLKTGDGPLLQLPASGRAHRATPVHVIHSTFRESGPFLEWAPGSRAAGQQIEILTKACVFAPAAESSVLALTGSLAPAGWESSISVNGLESLVKSGSRLVDLRPEKGKPRGAIDPRKLQVDGLMMADVEFFGVRPTDVAACALKSTDASFSVDAPPGIDPVHVARQLATP